MIKKEPPMEQRRRNEEQTKEGCGRGEKKSGDAMTKALEGGQESEDGQEVKRIGNGEVRGRGGGKGSSKKGDGTIPYYEMMS